jgi:hypothetical protein
MAKPEKYWIDMTDKRYGMLVAIKRVKHKNSLKYWLFKCDCGVEKIIDGDSARRGASRSCGCQHGANWKTHGMCNTPTYESWRCMIERCRDKTNASYKNYGALGITVCKRWLKFENFFADMGERKPGMTIDRLSPEANYEPANCRWATWIEQARSRRKPGTIKR